MPARTLPADSALGDDGRWVDGGTIETQGRIILQSVEHQGTELGPIEAFLVQDLALGVDLVLGLPLLTQHGCWIGEMEGKLGMVCVGVQVR